MFEKLTEHTYYRPAEPYTDRPNIGYVLGDEFSLLFEAGNSTANAEQLKSELNEQNLPLPNYVTVSHWHWDHSFGLSAWESVKIAGRKTNEKLLEVSNWKWDNASMDERIKTGEDIVFCTEMIKREYPSKENISVCAANITFENRMSISLGKITCELIHCKGPHAEDSIVCYIPEEKILFLGDSNCKDLYGKPWHFDIEHEEDFLENIAEIPYDSVLVSEYLSVLKPLDFEICVTGHAGIITKKELFSSF